MHPMNDEPLSELSRRDFLRAASAGMTAGALAGGLCLSDRAEAGPEASDIPTRVLGKTGVRVPILGFGTAPAGVRRSQKNAVELFHEAMTLGVNYFDTATLDTGYGNAQKYLGHAIKDRRKQAFVVTKVLAARADDALRMLKACLRDLQTDHVDLVYAHSLGSEPQMPIGVVTGKGGVLEGLAKAKRDGLTRFIGVSGHHRPWKFQRVLREAEIDVMMNAVNFVDRHTYDFEGRVWPLAAKKGVGLVAMKVFGGQVGMQMSNSKMPLEHHALSFRYALGLPSVTCAVIGMSNREELRRNVAWARKFTPLSPEEAAQASALGRRLAGAWGAHYGAV